MSSRSVHSAFSTHLSKNRSRCILSVDDEVAILYTRQAILQDAGYEVLNASDGEQALHIFASYCGGIDLVLLDYLMPGWNGGLVAQEMRRCKPGVPIILVSASTVPQKTLTSVNCRIDKGQSPTVLLDEIARLLTASQSRRRPPAPAIARRITAAKRFGTR